jgi:peptide/nickel transport system permease protein
MSDTLAATNVVAMEPRPSRIEPTSSRGFWARVLYDTFGKVGAKLGLVWVFALIVLAVLAPFMANSRPLLMRTAATGAWSSPLFQNLTWADLSIFTMASGLLAMFCVRKLRTPKFVFCLLIGVSVVGVAAALTLRPDRVNNFSRWRAMEASGQITNVIRVPIPYSPTDYARDTRDPNDPTRPVESPHAPTVNHWLGTERDGADLLSQMIHASRIALSIGIISTAISIAIGVTIGGLMGYYAGSVDLFGMRFIEIFEAVPRLVLLLAVAAIIGPNLYLLITVIGLLSWTGDARFIRAEFLRLRNLDFVQAAVALGLPRRTILFKHMLVNGFTPILVGASFSVASAILLESVLSFLGLGDADRPSWGLLLNQARSGGSKFYWWIAIFPGLAIFLTVFSYNLIGEAMRDALDPKLKKRD